MIHIVLPPDWRGRDCPYLQRTTNLLRVLDLLGEAHVEHAFEQSPFLPGGYGADAGRGDFVFYTWPEEKPIAPQTLPVECGVGYDYKPWGCRRVYESEVWRHHLWGKYGSTLDERQRSAVIPWAFDLDEWPLGDGSGGYVSYLGRLWPDKGIGQLMTVATQMPELEFRVASTESWNYSTPKNVTFVGPLFGRMRAQFLGGARVHLCPSEFIEPLNGSAIEAMLCGTPVVASDWGGFVETVVEGVTGFRCRETAEIAGGIKRAGELDRVAVRATTAPRFSIDTAARKWRRFLAR